MERLREVKALLKGWEAAFLRERRRKHGQVRGAGRCSPASGPGPGLPMRVGQGTLRGVPPLPVGFPPPPPSRGVHPQGLPLTPPTRGVFPPLPVGFPHTPTRGIPPHFLVGLPLPFPWDSPLSPFPWCISTRRILYVKNSPPHRPPASDQRP